jgi:hypothetical protein
MKTNLLSKVFHLMSEDRREGVGKVIKPGSKDFLLIAG